MQIVDYVRSRYALTHSIAPDSERQLLWSCRILEAWLLLQGLDATVSVPDELLLSRWIKWCELLYSPFTVKKIRGDVFAVLNDAADAEPPLRLPIRQRRVRRPVIPRPAPQAWRAETIQHLILASRQLPGAIATGIRRALYFESLLRVAWRTGLRRSDLWRLSLADVKPDGRVYVVQRKTRVPVEGTLGPEEIRLLHSFGYDPPLKWPHSERCFYHWSRAVKKLAGVTEAGHLHRIRKSAATDIARMDRGKVTRFLGHTNPSADVFYVDESLLDSEPIRPRELDL